MIARGIGLGLVAALAMPACTGAPRFDRDAAVERVVADNGGRVSRAQAECYVDRVLDELGSGPLEPGAEPRADQATRLTGIRVDCIGVANLGTAPAGTVATIPQEPGVTRAQHRGQDPHLDELYAACEAGSGAACDRLVDEAAVGSDYEAFGLTCGGRTSEVRCADRYPGPTTTTTTTTTTPPPPPGAPPPGAP